MGPGGVIKNMRRGGHGKNMCWGLLKKYELGIRKKYVVTVWDHKWNSPNEAPKPPPPWEADEKNKIRGKGSTINVKYGSGLAKIFIFPQDFN